MSMIINHRLLFIKKRLPVTGQPFLKVCIESVKLVFDESFGDVSNLYHISAFNKTAYINRASFEFS
jgi:hypothetical protein